MYAQRIKTSRMRHSQEPVAWPTMPLIQSLEPAETGRMLRACAVMGNDVPPNVKLIEGNESHGTRFSANNLKAVRDL